MTRVDLLLPELGLHDATSNHTRILRVLLEELGATVQIVVERHTSSPDATTLLDGWEPDADLFILQHAIGSEIANQVIKRRVPAVVNYHNVTPADLVEAWDPKLISGLRWGRSQLHELAPLARLGLAVSEFNAREMRSAQFRDVIVAPVLWDLPAANIEERQPVRAQGGRVLFVGRVAPNKCHHDLIAAMAVLRRFRPDASLVMVGADASPSYRRSLNRLVDRLGIAEGVEFTGSVTAAELSRRYYEADVFACLSAHEGFCIPIVEAMQHGVPVVAHRAAAVPETVDTAGLLLGDKHPGTVSAALERVLSDSRFAENLRAAGHRRAADFSLDRTIGLTRAVLTDRLGLAS